MGNTRFQRSCFGYGHTEFTGSSSSAPLSVVGGDGSFLLIGLCATCADVRDFIHTVSRKSARYAATIVPFWLRGGNQSNLRTSRAAIDSALTGASIAGTWSVYASGGIQSSQFDLSPSNDEIRTFKERYRLAGLTCEEDPAGKTQTHATQAL